VIEMILNGSAEGRATGRVVVVEAD
jgi:hypothetical protein